MIWLPTNGFLPEKIQETTMELLRQTDKPLIGVTISLDGEGEAHDIIGELQCPTCWLECEVYRDIRKDWRRLLDAYLWGFNQFS